MVSSSIDFNVSENSKKTTDFFTNLQKTLKETGNAFKNLFSDKSASAGFEALGKSSQDLNSNFNALIKANAKLSDSFGGVGKAAKIAFGSLGTLGAVFDAKFILDATSNAAYKLALSFSDLGKAYTILQAQGFNTQDIETVKLLGDAFKFNTQAAEEFAVRATVAFNEYDASLTRINTIIKASREELTQYGAGIQDLVSKDLKNAVTSTQALAGQYEVLSGGFTDAASSQQVLSAGLKLATIGQSDQGETLRLLVKTMQAYKISSADAAKTAAQLNGIVELGITTVSELTQGFGQTATVASQAGIKINELGAAVAALTVKGTSTPASLTGIEALSRIIIDKTPEAAKALAELRDQAGKPIRFDISEIKAKGLTKALQDLNTATGGNATTLAAIIPESLAYSTALGLLSNNSATLAENTSKLGEVTSKSLEEVFGISLGDKTKEFQQIVNRFGEVLIKFGQAIAPAFDKGIDALEKVSEFLINLPDPIKNAAVSFVLLGVGANKTFGAFNALAELVVKLGGLFLTQRAISLLLNGTFNDEVKTVQALVAAKAGLIPILKQIIGIDQQALVTSKAGVNFTQEQVKASEGLAAAIEKEIAVKKANVAVKKASSGAEEASEALRASSGKVAQLTGFQNELLNKQVIARNILLDSASSYEAKVDATVKLQELENALNKNAIGLKAAQKEEQEKLKKSIAESKLLETQETNLKGAKDDAAKLIQAKVEAQKLSEQATIAQSTAESARLAVVNLENAADKNSVAITQAKILAERELAIAQNLTTLSKEKNLAVGKLEDALNTKRLIAQGKLNEATIFGQKILVSSEGIIGKINAALLTQVGVQGTVNKEAGFGAIIQGVLSAAGLGFAKVLQIIQVQAAKTWAAVSGPLLPLVLLIAAVGSAAALLFETFAGGGGAARETREEFQKINKELDEQKTNLGAAGKEFQNFSAASKGNLFTDILDRLKELTGGFVDLANLTTGLQDTFANFTSTFSEGIAFVNDTLRNAVPGFAVFQDTLSGIKGFIDGLFDNFNANQIVNTLAQIGDAQKTSQETGLALTRTINLYRNGLLSSDVTNDKLRKGIQLTTEDLAKENETFVKNRKFVDAELAANEKRIEAIDKLIEKKGKDSDAGKQLAIERDLLIGINEQNRQRLQDLDKEKKFNDALQQARNDSRKNELLNSNEIIPQSQVDDVAKKTDDIKKTTIDSFGGISKFIKGASEDVSKLTDDQLSKLQVQVNQTAEAVKTGLLPTQEFVKQAGLNATNLTNEQLNLIKKAVESGDVAKINRTLAEAAKQSKQDYKEINNQTGRDLVENFQKTSEEVNKINKDALDKSITQFSTATGELADIRKRQKSTLEEDLGGSAFQTTAKKTLRLATEDYNDYLQQYKAAVEGQRDATGKLYYLTVEDQKKANELSGKDREEFLAKYRKDITLTDDQLKKSFFDGRQNAVIESASAALDAGAISSQDFADKLGTVRESFGKLATPQQLQDISGAIIDAEKASLSTFNALLSQSTAYFNAQQDARLSKASEVQRILLELENDRINKTIATKEREVSEYEKTGQTEKQKQAEAELTTLKAQQSGIRIKIDEAEIDSRFEKQKEALGRELKLQEAKSEAVKVIADQEQKLTKSRLDLSRAQADLDISRISNAAKLSGDSVVQAQSEVQIAERNLKLVDAKNAFEKQSLKTQNLLNEIALERQKTQVELNKLELQSTILKTKALIANKETSAAQKESLSKELEVYNQQSGLLDKQSSALETAAKNQKEVSTNSEKELDIRQKINKEGSAVDLQIAKQRVVIAEIEKYVKILNAQQQAQENLAQIQLNNLDAQLKATEQLNKLLNDRKAIADEIANITQGQYSLAAGLAQTEFGSRRIEREAAVEKKATLVVQQQIEKVLFDLQLKQNEAARERLTLENQLLQLKTKAESLQARADLARLEATKGITQAEIEAAKANVQAKDAAFAGSISAGDLIKVSNKNEKALEEFRKISFSQKQKADALGADADIAKTTLTKSDDRKVQREALANARDSKGVLNDVLDQISKDNPTSLDVGKSLAAANRLAQQQIGAALANNPIPGGNVPANNIAPFNGRLNAPTSNAPNNQGLNNGTTATNNNNADNNSLKNVKIDAPITIEINLSGQEGDVKKVGNRVAEEIATSLRDLFKRAENS